LEQHGVLAELDAASILKILETLALGIKKPPHEAGVLNEADGNRTRNLRIDSPML
jgi:hypothetical protein